MQPPSSPQSRASEPLREALSAWLPSQLTAELEATNSLLRHAALLHESAVATLEPGDPAQRITQLLGAADLAAGFQEPLFLAIDLAERQHGAGLAEAAARFAEVEGNAGIEARLLAAFLALREGNYSAAHGLLDDALERDATEPTTWLLYEWLARRSSDRTLLERALESQLEATAEPHFRGLIQLELARVGRALESSGERRAHKLADLWALEAQALGVLFAASMGRESFCTNEASAFALFRAALLGPKQSALSQLEAASAALPQHRGLATLALEHAVTEADVAAAKGLLARLLPLGLTDEAAASLWLLLASCHARLGQQSELRTAVLEACARKRTSPLALAYAHQIFGQPGSEAELLSHYEAVLEGGGSASAPVLQRAILGAARIAALGMKDHAKAEAILTGQPAEALADDLGPRLECLLAAVEGDNAWLARAEQRLLGKAGPGERDQLAFRILRRQALARTLPDLGGAEPPALQLWLGAYPTAQGSSLDALQTLAESITDPDHRQAYRVAATLRASREQPQARVELLLRAEHEHEAEPVASLVRAELLAQASQFREASAALDRVALGSHDLTFAGALLLQAGYLAWHGGDQEGAVATFERAWELVPRAAESALAWALRGASGEDQEARRASLSFPVSEDAAALHALERFTFEALVADDQDAAEAAMLELEAAAPQELGSTLALCRALHAASRKDGDMLAHSLDGLAEWGDSARRIARATAYYVSTEADTQPSSLAQAEQWVHADASLLPALEWWAAARSAGEPRTEALALYTLGTRLGGEESGLLKSAAALLTALSGEEPRPRLDGTDAASRLAALELAPPGSDPRRRSHALAAGSDLLADEDQTLATVLCGYNLLACGEFEHARRAFSAAAAKAPEDLFVWDGLRAVAEATDDPMLLAEALAGLGDCAVDAAEGAQYWEQAAFILLDSLGEQELGEHALRRAVERDVRLTRSFERWFRRLRELKANDELLPLIAARLEVTDDPAELSKLFWERARALRSLGNLPGALTALESVAALEPHHTGALALAAEICIAQGDFAEAAELLARFSGLDEAPREQRLMSGVAAVDLYENKLNDSARALGLLAQLYEAGLSTLPIRERFARGAARAGAWDQAAQVLFKLASDRETPSGRAEAARLAMAIAKDRLSDGERARRAAKLLLDLEPADPEALDLLLESGAGLEVPLAQRSRELLVAQVLAEPLEASRVHRLARVAEVLGDTSLRQATLGALLALGQGDPSLEQELLSLDARAASLPGLALSDQWVTALLDPRERGPLSDLFLELGAELASVLEPGLAELGVTRKQRVDARQGVPLRAELAAWAGALGLGEFELYLGGNAAERVRGLAGSPPSLVLGAAVTAPLNPRNRAAAAREFFALRRGTTVLVGRDLPEAGALLSAIYRTAGATLDAPAYALTAEFERRLTRGLSRKARKALAALAPHLPRQLDEALRFVRGAQGSVDRAAAVCAGDASWALASDVFPRGQRPVEKEALGRLGHLLGFVLSPAYLELRERLGLGAR